MHKYNYIIIFIFLDIINEPEYLEILINHIFKNKLKKQSYNSYIDNIVNNKK